MRNQKLSNAPLIPGMSAYRNPFGMKREMFKFVRRYDAVLVRQRVRM